MKIYINQFVSIFLPAQPQISGIENEKTKFLSLLLFSKDGDPLTNPTTNASYSLKLNGFFINRYTIQTPQSISYLVHWFAAIYKSTCVGTVARESAARGHLRINKASKGKAKQALGFDFWSEV